MTNKIIYQGRSIVLEERDLELPNGGVSKSFPLVRHQDGAIVVPLLEKYHEYDVVLIRQWRPAMGLEVLEVPGGGINKDETPEYAARREVMEEAGLISGELIFLGKVLPAPGWDVETQYHFIAICKSELYEQPQDDSDLIERVRVPLSKIPELLKAREIIDLKTRSILYDALNYLKRIL